MKFIVDAQLPRLLAIRLRELGHEATHTLDLDAGNRTQDDTIADLAESIDAVVVTKDRDFLDTHLLHGKPPLLLMVATGNISNHRLLCLFETHISLIAQFFEQTTWVELNREGIILHG